MDNAYVPWTGDRKAHRARMKYFVASGAKRSLLSKWTFAILIIPFMLIVVPSVINAFFQSSYPAPLDYYMLYEEPGIFILLLAALLGSGVFASDISQKSHILLYVHGLTKGGYIVGRLSSFFISFLSMTLLPITVVFIVSLASGSGSTGLTGGIADFVRAAAAMLFMTLYLCLLTAALSCVSGDRKYAGAGLIAIYYISMILSEVLYEISGSDLVMLISIKGNMDAAVSWAMGISSSLPGKALFALVVVMALCIVTIYYRLMGKEAAI